MTRRRPSRAGRAGSWRVDLVLWDIVDERLGLHLHADGGITTDTVESRTLGATGGSEPTDEGEAADLGATGRPARHVPFGSDEHFALFVAALPAWRSTLERVGLLDRTVLVAPPWAALTTEGEPSAASFGLTAETGNDRSRRYLDAAVEALGLPVVGRDLVQADVAGIDAGRVRSDVGPPVGSGRLPLRRGDLHSTSPGASWISRRERAAPSGWGASDTGVRVPTAVERDPSLRHPSNPASPSPAGPAAGSRRPSRRPRSGPGPSISTATAAG